VVLLDAEMVVEEEEEEHATDLGCAVHLEDRKYFGNTHALKGNKHLLWNLPMGVSASSGETDTHRWYAHPCAAPMQLAHRRIHRSYVIAFSPIRLRAHT
jgi:hypothetical protein